MDAMLAFGLKGSATIRLTNRPQKDYAATMLQPARTMGMPVVQFLSRRMIRKQALEDAARALDKLAEVAPADDTTRAFVEAAELLRVMAERD